MARCVGTIAAFLLIADLLAGCQAEPGPGDDPTPMANAPAASGSGPSSSLGTTANGATASDPASTQASPSTPTPPATPSMSAFAPDSSAQPSMNGGQAGSGPAGQGGAAGQTGTAGQGATGEPPVNNSSTTGQDDPTQPDSAGTGAAPANGGNPDVPGVDDDPTAARPPCMQDPRQVILMGDSYMNWVSHTFPQDMAKNFGNGAEGVWDVPYVDGGRLYAIGAWAMGSGGIGLIPDQLDFALADDPNIIAGIMTGGGNDVLVPGIEWPGGGDCKNSSALPPTEVCQQITETAFDAARDLMMRSADAGMRDVVYFFYPEVPAPTLIGGDSPNTILGWTYPMVEDLCNSTEEVTGGRLRCHFLDTRPIFDGHPDYFAPTDIHPNSAGSDALTKAIAALMRDRCIAQSPDSGCCEP